MSDRFAPIPMEKLCHWVFSELAQRDSIFGIPREMFFVPGEKDPFAQTLYGQRLDTPFGVAAGPHSQMAQNIIAAWLCGARFIELKTVQTLDELEVAKPCIDMEDEGYNVEWSQELKVEESFDEYLRAWVLIHALHKHLGFPGEGPGVIFNVSVGYDLAGIQRPNVRWFLEHVQQAGDLLGEHVEAVAGHFPGVRDLAIPQKMANSVTLSTMHGCPPDEIGRICEHLLKKWGFHVSAKLNPTLLGPERLRALLNEELGYGEVDVPDAAFEHDIGYDDAVALIKDLRRQASDMGLLFGVKTTNTLEVRNHRAAMDGGDGMMYMSGAPLQAITASVARRLSRSFDGELLISYSGGADAWSAPDLLRCGIRTVTSCTDLLKSGGYLRMLQYVQNTAAAMDALGAGSLDQFVIKSAAAESWASGREGDGPAAAGEEHDLPRSALVNLDRFIEQVMADPTLRKGGQDRSQSKTGRELGPFDCIMAPCMDECPIQQQVPRYMRLVRSGRLEEAVAVTREDNSMAATLGRACDHRCELTCTRIHMDEPLAIREIKRFIMEQEGPPLPVKDQADQETGRGTSVAVIGSGPCGLAVAYFLAPAGYRVTLFEARSRAGGMVGATIPRYRLAETALSQDLNLIESLGAEIRFGAKAGADVTLGDLRGQGFRHVVVAAGAQVGLSLGMDGEDAQGVLDGLDFLCAVRNGEELDLGQRVGIIGGGDVAMDCGRTAQRLGASKVMVIYRRTMAQMPAQQEEIEGLLEEGIELVELNSPLAVKTEDGRISALTVERMELGQPDASGRRRPVATGETYDLPLDSLLVAIGQRADLSFFEEAPPTLERSGYIQVAPHSMETSIPGVYAGGDVASDGPSSIVKAGGDGKRIAAEIRRREEGWTEDEAHRPDKVALPKLLGQRARRQRRVHVDHLPPGQRTGFKEVVSSLEANEAVREASRCLSCDLMCSTCVSVCPNLAFFTYQAPALDVRLPKLHAAAGGMEQGEDERYTVTQLHQVAVLADFCNECGNCATFCPTSGRPYKDKPRLYLDRGQFEAEADNAYCISHSDEDWTIEGRFGGETHTLVQGNELRYSSPHLQATLDPETFALLGDAAPGASCQDGEALSLVPAAQMYTLLRGMRGSQGHRPSA